MVTQKKRQLPFFPMPMKFFRQTLCLNEKKTRLPAILAESLNGSRKINLVKQPVNGSEGYLLYAEKMQQQPDKENDHGSCKLMKTGLNPGK